MRAISAISWACFHCDEVGLSLAQSQLPCIDVFQWQTPHNWPLAPCSAVCAALEWLTANKRGGGWPQQVRLASIHETEPLPPSPRSAPRTLLTRPATAEDFKQFSTRQAEQTTYTTRRHELLDLRVQSDTWVFLWNTSTLHVGENKHMAMQSCGR